MAALMATIVTTKSATLMDDCANVVNAFACRKEGNEEAGTDVKRKKDPEAMMYGAVVRQARRNMGRHKTVDVQKCAAHVLDKMTDEQAGQLTPEQLHAARGNDAADRHAKAAMSLFPAVDPALLGRLDRDALHARAAVSVIAKVLPLWPLTKAKKKRARKAARRGSSCLIRLRMCTA